MKRSLVLCGLLLMGCSTPSQFAYVSSNKDRICVFKIASDGKLTAASNISTGMPEILELSSDGATLVGLGRQGAQAYHRDLSAGALSVWGSRVKGCDGDEADLVASGNNFYAAFARKDGMTSYRLDPQDGLKNLANFESPREAPVALAVTPDGQGLVMCCGKPGMLANFKVTPVSGQLELGSVPKIGGNLRGVAVDPSGKWVLAITSMDLDLDPRLLVFKRQGGELAEVSNIVIPSPQSEQIID
jgi:6-phosphogluconolactonase (cycloisomerase 2 family)